MRTCHFVYAGEPDNDLNHAPYTITRNVHGALLPGFDRVIYYDWCHCGPFEEVGPDDIIIGHPNYPEATATRQLFKNKCRTKILMFPLHHAMPEINFPFDDLVRQADAVLSITGPYWYDTIETTKFAHWKEKIVRLDMAIDSSRFPVVKTSFNEPGNRAFFYIGADRPEKGLDVLHRIFAGTKHQIYLYGMISDSCGLARLPNAHLRGWADMTPEFGRDLASIADCYVHGGVSDANPTTLLETACWGFQVACTPQSGYWPGQPFHGLNAQDIDGCRNFLDYIQYADNDVLVARSVEMRRAVTTVFTWDIFLSKVINTVRRFL